jgi:hypothetical protein
MTPSWAAAPRRSRRRCWGRVPWGNDINPLSLTFTRPRLQPPTLAEVSARLQALDLADAGEVPEELLVFYHPETLRELCALRQYFLCRRATGKLDAVDGWLCMVALKPIDRPFTRLLLGLYPAAQPGGVGRFTAQDQRQA